MSSVYTSLLRFDGGANPNPGPCAGAYVIYNDRSEVIAEGGEYFEKGTNNIGEYAGLLGGLERCVEMGLEHVDVQGDSMLVIQQVQGRWKVKQPHLIPLCERAVGLKTRFTHITFSHIRREMNGHADQLSDNTLERKSTWRV